MIQEEEWKPSPLYNGILASSHGRIMRETHFCEMPYGGVRAYKSEPIFGSITSAAKGARHVYFGTNYKGIGNVKVHRAVCAAFHGLPPDPKSVVIHLNENALDNRPMNLKWGTQKENLNAPAFKAYNRRANKVNGGSKGIPQKTSDIYFGLPHLIETIRSRRDSQE